MYLFASNEGRSMDGQSVDINCKHALLLLKTQQEYFYIIIFKIIGWDELCIVLHPFSNKVLNYLVASGVSSDNEFASFSQTSSLYYLTSLLDINFGLFVDLVQDQIIFI